MVSSSDGERFEGEEAWPVERVREKVKSGLGVVSLYGLEVIEADFDGSLVSMASREAFTRPGGMIAGPVLFAMADLGGYAFILGRSGDSGALTVGLNVNFLGAAFGDVFHARTRPVRFGRRIAVLETEIYAVESPDRIFMKAIATWMRSS